MTEETKPKPLSTAIPPAALGGQVAEGAIAEAPPRRAFKINPLKGEPKTDRLLALEGGEYHRERILSVDARATGVRSSADAAATAFTLTISHALADAAGKVQVDEAGKPIIAPAHEIYLSADALGRLEAAGELDEAIQVAREEAAAMAARSFAGVQAGARLRAKFNLEGK